MRKLILSTLFFITIASMIYSCQSSEQLKQDIYYANGRDLYIKHCQNCHGSKGEGLNALAPPLTDTAFLKINKQKIACFIKNGSSGPITINGKIYDGKMPDFATLANIDIAQIVVYITNTYGNNQGMYTAEQIAEDLKNCK